MTSLDVQQRLDQLEAHVAQQDQTIDDLNTTITDQWKMLEKFKTDLARLTAELQDLDQGGSASGAGEKPPHY